MFGISVAVCQGSIEFRASGKQVVMWQNGLVINSIENPERNDQKGWKKSSRASGDGASPHFRRLLFAGLAKYTSRVSADQGIEVSEVIFNFFTECSGQGYANLLYIHAISA